MQSWVCWYEENTGEIKIGVSGRLIDCALALPSDLQPKQGADGWVISLGDANECLLLSLGGMLGLGLAECRALLGDAVLAANGISGFADPLVRGKAS